MSRAYYCDGCQEYQTGQPVFHTEATLFIEASWPPDGWDFCTLECIELWVTRMRAQVKEQTE